MKCSSSSREKPILCEGCSECLFYNQTIQLFFFVCLLFLLHQYLLCSVWEMAYFTFTHEIWELRSRPCSFKSLNLVFSPLIFLLLFTCFSNPFFLHFFFFFFFYNLPFMKENEDTEVINKIKIIELPFPESWNMLELLVRAMDVLLCGLFMWLESQFSRKRRRKKAVTKKIHKKKSANTVVSRYCDSQVLWFSIFFSLPLSQIFPFPFLF